MNPLVQAALGSVLRWALMFFTGWFVQRGIWTKSDAETYVMGATVALLTLAWSLWQKYRTRLTILTALSMPAGTSEAKLADRVKQENAS